MNQYDEDEIRERTTVALRPAHRRAIKYLKKEDRVFKGRSMGYIVDELIGEALNSRGIDLSAFEDDDTSA